MLLSDLFIFLLNLDLPCFEFLLQFFQVFLAFRVIDVAKDLALETREGVFLDVSNRFL